jgi:hypothetical protein
MIGTGDYLDLIVKTDQKRFTGTALDDESLKNIDNLIGFNIDRIVDELRPLKDKILGLATGNHEEEIKKRHSIDVTKTICDRLDVPYLGYSFFYRLTVKKKRGGLKRNCIIYGHHGFGGGRKPGASVNKLIDAITSYDADIILSGHDHYKIGTRHTRMGITPSGKPKLVRKPVVVARTGTFLKTCMEGDITYSERMGYPPTDLGVVRIDISFQGRDKELDIHVSE